MTRCNASTISVDLVRTEKFYDDWLFPIVRYLFLYIANNGAMHYELKLNAPRLPEISQIW